MKHGSLFSGIGGFDLAAEWMGWENVFHCEINPFGQKILKHYWPKAISYEDITTTDFTVHRGQIDILTGGFPCQPFSLAGKRKGTEDDRNLWPEYYRAIKEIQPTWVVGENVHGIINWSGGLVFEQVQADLENEGYEVWPVILPACGINAPHRRERVWFIAYRNSARLQTERPEQKTARITRCRLQWIATYSASNRWKWERERVAIKNRETQPGINRKLEGRFEGLRIYKNATNSAGIGRIQDNRKREPRFIDKTGKITNWTNFPTQSPICGGNDGIPRGLDGITFPKWRNESIKAYGNAVVPPLVYQIFKAIEKID